MNKKQIRTKKEYKKEVFDLLTEKQKLDWLYGMSLQLNKFEEEKASEKVGYALIKSTGAYEDQSEEIVGVYYSKTKANKEKKFLTEQFEVKRKEMQKRYENDEDDEDDEASDFIMFELDTCYYIEETKIFE